MFGNYSCINLFNLHIHLSLLHCHHKITDWTVRKSKKQGWKKDMEFLFRDEGQILPHNEIGWQDYSDKFRGWQLNVSVIMFVILMVIKWLMKPFCKFCKLDHVLYATEARQRNLKKQRRSKRQHIPLKFKPVFSVNSSTVYRSKG